MSTCSVVGQQFIDFVETSTAGGTPVLVAHNGEALHMLFVTIHGVPVSATSTRVSAYSKRCMAHERQCLSFTSCCRTAVRCAVPQA